MEEDKILTFRDGRRYLKLDSALLLTQLAELRKGKYDGAAIGRIHGYELDNIDPLAEVPSLEGIHIQDSIPDVSALTQLKGLKHILVTGLHQQINFSKFSRLEQLSIGEWNENAIGIDKCARLERLYVRNFSPSRGELGLAMLAAPNLCALEVVQSSLTSLKGLDGFSKLEEFIVRYFTKLTDISDLSHATLSLRKLLIDRCKKVQGYDVIGDLSGLVNLGINASGEIPSLDFVSRLRKLETIGLMDTNLKDGNLAPLLRLEHLRFAGLTDKKHHSHKEAQLKKMLDARRVGT